MGLGMFWHCLKDTFTAWNKDNAPRMAAALAYYSTFSIAPLLLIVIWIAGLIFGEAAARGEIVQELRSTLGESAAASLEETLQNSAVAPGGTVSALLGIVVLLAGAAGAFVELQSALNQIWRAPSTAQASWWSLIRNRLLSFSVVVGCGFLLLVSLIVSAGLEALHKFVSANVLVGHPLLWQAIHFIVSLGVVTVLFAMIFKLLPDVRLQWRDMWVGALLTAVLFTLGKFLLGLYLAHGSAASTYGAAGTLVVWLIWVYYSSLLVLFGAEFTRVYATREAERPAARPAASARPAPLVNSR